MILKKLYRDTFCLNVSHSAQCSLHCSSLIIITSIYFQSFGLTTGSPSPASRQAGEVTLIKPHELENHNREGGLWVVIHGKVYDLADFKDQVCKLLQSVVVFFLYLVVTFFEFFSFHLLLSFYPHFLPL